MTRLLTAGAIMLGMALPVMAEEEYFVALDMTIHQCRLMSIQPDGTTMKMVGDASYPTLDEAREAMDNCPSARARQPNRRVAQVGAGSYPGVRHFGPASPCRAG